MSTAENSAGNRVLTARQWLAGAGIAALLLLPALVPTAASAQFYYQPFSYRWRVEPETISPGEAVERVREAGFSRVSRPAFRGDVYIVEAYDLDRSRVRLIVDAYDGHILQTISLDRPRPRSGIRGNIIEIDPEEEPTPRFTPQRPVPPRSIPQSSMPPRLPEATLAPEPPRRLQDTAPERPRPEQARPELPRTEQPRPEQVRPRREPPLAVVPGTPGSGGQIEQSVPRRERPAATPPATPPAPRIEAPAAPRPVAPPVVVRPAPARPAPTVAAPATSPGGPPAAVTSVPPGAGTRQAPRVIEITPPAPLDETSPGTRRNNAPINSVPPAVLE